jgi:glucose/arabinose dehydrogenase
MNKKLLTAALAAALVAGAYQRTGWAQLAAGEPATNFTMTDWATGLGEVTDIAWLKDGRAVVVRKSGQIHVASPDGKMVQMGASITVDTESEKGLLGVVVDAQDNIYLYASTGNDDTNKHKVYKARAAADGTVTVDLTNPIVSMGLEGPANHDGGGLIIYKDHLYISVGDTGANNTPPQNKYGACLNKPNGKILRVKLDGTVPDDNPLSGLAMVTSCATRTGGMFAMAPPDKRIWAWGFRNPWRFWIDPRTDLMWIGDVGETTQEEITIGGKGTNHGWPFNEGTIKYNAPLGGLSDCTMMTPNTACTPPAHAYPRGDGTSVTGGLIPPTGCGWGAFENRYFFADYNRGVIWTLDVAGDRRSAVANSRKNFATTGGTEDSIVSFRAGPDGAMYLASYNPGSVVRIAPKTIPSACQAAVAPPPDAGATGGAGGAGTGGAGGAGTGGAGGAGGATGGGAGGSTGGRGGSGGSGGRGGTGGSAGSTDDGGCGCDLGATASGRLPGGAALVVLGALVVWGRRRRRR